MYVGVCVCVCECVSWEYIRAYIFYMPMHINKFYERVCLCMRQMDIFANVNVYMRTCVCLYMGKAYVCCIKRVLLRAVWWLCNQAFIRVIKG